MTETIFATQAKYAELHGVSDRAVRKWITNGTIAAAVENGRIHIAKADRLLLAANRKKNTGSGSALKAAEARRMSAYADSAELKFRRLQASLFPTEAAIEYMREDYDAIRRRCRRITDEVMPRLAGVKDPKEVREILLDAIDAALTELADCKKEREKLRQLEAQL